MVRFIEVETVDGRELMIALDRVDAVKSEANGNACTIYIGNVEFAIRTPYRDIARLYAAVKFKKSGGAG